MFVHVCGSTPRVTHLLRVDLVDIDDGDNIGGGLFRLVGKGREQRRLTVQA